VFAIADNDVVVNKLEEIVLPKLVKSFTLVKVSPYCGSFSFLRADISIICVLRVSDVLYSISTISGFGYFIHFPYSLFPILQHFNAMRKVLEESPGIIAASGLVEDSEGHVHFPCYSMWCNRAEERSIQHRSSCVAKGYTNIVGKCAVCELSRLPFAANMQLLHQCLGEGACNLSNSFPGLAWQIPTAVCPEHILTGSTRPPIIPIPEHLDSSYCGSSAVKSSRHNALQLLKVVVNILNENSHQFPYVLATGTLLGAIKHGTLLMPWDTDADVYIPLTSTGYYRVQPHILLRKFKSIIRPQLESHGLNFISRGNGRRRLVIGKLGMITVDINFLLLKQAEVNKYVPPRRFVLNDGTVVLVPREAGKIILERTGHNFLRNPCSCSWKNGRIDNTAVSGLSEQCFLNLVERGKKMGVDGVQKICKTCSS